MISIMVLDDISAIDLLLAKLNTSLSSNELTVSFSKSELIESIRSIEDLKHFGYSNLSYHAMKASFISAVRYYLVRVTSFRKQN